MSNFIPAANAQFILWVTAFLYNLDVILTRVGFPADVYSNLDALRSTFIDANAIAENPATCTKAAIQARKEARDVLEKALRKAIAEYLTNNHKVTDEDRDNLGLPIHKTSHTPIPVPTTYPDYSVATDVLRRLTVHFHDHNSEHRGKPAGISGAVIHWALLDTPPKSVDELNHSALDTSSPFTVEFSEEQRGS
ncbi:MAG: hypothetical protein LBS16_03710, partial [Prevotellaceae bacterium]|nr:hypothetical protein [Prevotellaceae bacterium]